MPNPLRFRLIKPTEPALNVLLAELLSRKGLQTVGEVMIHRGGVSRPDVYMTIEGMPVILEGRFEAAGVAGSLERDCRHRLEQDLCYISVALVYPPLPLRLTEAFSHQELKEFLQTSRYKVKLFYISSAGIEEAPWQEGLAFFDLATLLRQVHQRVASEDRLAPAVAILKEGLVALSSSFAKSADLTALAERLREVMGLLEARPEKSAQEEEA